MYPGTYAAEAPDRVATVMTGTGETLSYKAPRTVRFVENLPRSETGKLMKSQLKAKYTGG